jgi:DNA recombination protein RmuC
MSRFCEGVRKVDLGSIDAPAWALTASGVVAGLLMAFGGLLWQQRRLGRALREEWLRAGSELSDGLMKRFGDAAGLQQLQLEAVRRAVGEQLEQIQHGLGQIEGIAVGMTDLKQVFANVKVRGLWGEVQLHSLLAEFLDPDQYAREVQTRRGSDARVDFAVRLRDPQGEAVDLPIDAKFPVEDFVRLQQARERTDATEIARAERAFAQCILTEGKRIAEKYLDPPHTTDFAVLFVPTEGLYAEIVRLPGAIERLYRDSRIALAGPATLGALLSAVRLGLRAIVLQERAGDMGRRLIAALTELDRIETGIERLQRQLSAAVGSADGLAHRARSIRSELETGAASPPLPRA